MVVHLLHLNPGVLELMLHFLVLFQHLLSALAVPRLYSSLTGPQRVGTHIVEDGLLLLGSDLLALAILDGIKIKVVVDGVLAIKLTGHDLLLTGLLITAELVSKEKLLLQGLIFKLGLRLFRVKVGLVCVSHVVALVYVMVRLLFQREHVDFKLGSFRSMERWFRCSFRAAHLRNYEVLDCQAVVFLLIHV